MCLIVFAWQPGHALPLLVAANRDEFYARLEPAAGGLGGRRGGIRRTRPGGRRHLAGARPGRPFRRPDQRPRSVAGSRQALPWRTGGGLPARRRQPGRLPGAGRRARCGLFRLQPAHWRSPSALALQPPRRATAPAAGGVYGLSNAALDTPWPKLLKARAALAEWLAEPHPQALLELLADAAPAADSQLPDTGVGLATERLLSSVFIASPSYGTRASSVVRVHADGTREMIERSFGPSGARLGEVSLVLPPG